jgi:hypothetical protein
MKRLIIAGGGKFGKKALEFAQKNNYSAILIDEDPNCPASSYTNKLFKSLEDLKLNLEDLQIKEVYFFNHDISIIYKLFREVNPEYLIPVVPVHILTLIIKEFLSEKKNINLISDGNSALEFSSKVKKEIALAQNNEQAIIYLSYAKIDELCPDNCFGPANYCPNFKREKPITITEYVREFYGLKGCTKIIKKKIPQIIIVIESYQLQSGLGGLLGKDIHYILKKLGKNLKLFSEKEFRLIIATTCNCHGVLDFYKVSV